MDGAEWFELFLMALLVDDGKPLLKALQYDIPEPTMNAGLKIYRMSRFRRLIMLQFAKLVSEHLLSCHLHSNGVIRGDERLPFSQLYSPNVGTGE